MIAYNGGSISNFLINFQRRSSLYVTDAFERAIAYANAQATGAVDPDACALAEGTIILHVECEEPEWLRRPASHSTLDKCEAVVRDYRIVKATIRFHSDFRTKYGNRWTGYHDRKQVLAIMEKLDIGVEEIS